MATLGLNMIVCVVATLVYFFLERDDVPVISFLATTGVTMCSSLFSSLSVGGGFPWGRSVFHRLIFTPSFSLDQTCNGSAAVE